MLAGVDGCKGGWVAVIQGADGHRVVEKMTSLAELIAKDELELAVIDVPIGLMDGQPRAADVTARRFLGTRGCCVFPAPYRSVTVAGTYLEACDRQRVDGKRMSRQAFGILPKISEVDSLMTEDLQAKIKEGHPEVSFAVLNSDVAIPTQKKKRSGSESRLRLLQPHFPELEALIRRPRHTGVALDDLLDAYAMIWTAIRVKHGEYGRFPIAPQVDSRGLRAEIVA
jgi:predicted RNase H-like nuclease